MTLTIQRTDLVRTMTHATKAVESRNTIPILANVLLQADDGKLTVTATDLDIQISSTAPAEGTLSATVDAKRLSDIARRLSGDVVTLDQKDDKLVVKSGRSRFTLPTLPIEDFPHLDAGDLGEPFQLDFAALVAPDKFAISSDATRYYLNGVHLHNTAEMTAAFREAFPAARRPLIVVGGPRFDESMAGELGVDRIFGKGTTPGEVASYLVHRLVREG